MLKLRGRTQKGKNRIRELGESWEIIASVESVGFSSEKNWILIHPVLNPDKIRWIRANDDIDFEIIREAENDN